MKYLECQNELNEYVKNLSILISMDYREFFGVEDDLFLYQFSTSEKSFVKFLDNKSREDIVYSMQEDNEEFPTIFCNPMHPSLNGKDIEEKKEIFKQYLPFEIFSFLIHSTVVVGNVSDEVMNFGEFLNVGLIEVLTQEFASNHNLKIASKNLGNKMFAMELLEGIPEGIDKRKMIFQNNFLYMLDFFQMTTGRDLREKYQQTIIKPHEFSNLKVFVSQYVKKEDKELLWNKIVLDCRYSVAIEELSTYMLLHYKGKSLEGKMEELFQIFPEYCVFNVRHGNALAMKKPNGFSMAVAVVVSSIFFGIFLAMLIK